MSIDTLTEAVREETGCTNAQARAAVDRVFGTIKGMLKVEGRFLLRDFGTFRRRDLPGRTARNPRTGDPIQIGPRSRVTFLASPALKGELKPARPKGTQRRKAA